MSESKWRAGSSGLLPLSSRRLLLPLAVLALFAALLASQTGPAQLAHATDTPTPTPVVVKPSTIVGTGPTAWCFYDDDTDECDGTGQMVTGPGTAPIGAGSAAMTVGVSTGRQDILTTQFDGVALSSITTLTYKARSTATSGNNNVFLQFNTDFGTSASTYQGRLSFSPSTSSFTSNAWQTWDARSDLDGVWYTSKSIDAAGGTPTAPCDATTNGCTWSEVQQYWPNAKIANPATPGNGALLFRVGNPGGDYTGYVDDFHIVTNTVDETFDFDPDKFCTTTCYVDDSATGTGDGQQESPFNTIQAALNHVSPNGTVNVLAGTYNEDIVISTSGVTLKGAGADQTIIVGPKTGTANVVSVGGVGATVDGVTISRDGNNTTDWVSNPVNQGISIGADNVTLQNSKITHNRNGVYVRAANNVTIKDNLITDNRTGIQVNDGNSAAVTTNNLLIENNAITNNWTLGVLFNQVSTGVSLSYSTGIKINNNNISGNWYGGINARWAAQGDAIDATSNWFGSTTPSVLAGNSSEPGYNGQIPTEFGGTASAPATLGQDIIWSSVNNTTDPLTFVPMLCTATDGQDSTIGFQPPASSCQPGSTQPPSGGAVASSNSGVIDGSAGNTTISDGAGFEATYSGSGTVYTQLATYSGNPETDAGSFFGTGSKYFDVFVSVLTADPNATLAVQFSGLTDGQVLRWYDGTAWQSIRNNDGTTPVISGGTTTVTFGAYSSPRLDQLSGTPISSGDPNAIEVQLVGGNSVASGQQVTVNVIGKATALQGVDFYINYDSAVLKLGAADCTAAASLITRGTGLAPDSEINYTTNFDTGYTGCDGFEYNDTTGSIRISFAENTTFATGNNILLATITLTGKAANNLTSTSISAAAPVSGPMFVGNNLVPLTVTVLPALQVGGGGAVLTGTVQLQGVSDYSGTTVTVTDGTHTYTAPVTGATGAFSVAIDAPGTYTISAVHDGYVRVGNQTYAVVAGTTPLSTVTLLAGDFDGDGIVGLPDLSMIASTWGLPSTSWPPFTPVSASFGPDQSPTPDFNGDGNVNLVELSAVAANWNKTIIAWP